MPYTIPSSVISPGAVYQPRKSKLILDQISGAIAAWSTRRLISSAPADIARGRDASTTEENFTAAELAGSGFTDLAGAGDGFYVTLYDQIGSNNATQVTAASQPKGVDTGTLITDGVIPVLEFDGVNDVLVATPVSVTAGMTLCFKISANFSAAATSKGIFSSRIDANNLITIIHTSTDIWTLWTISGVSYGGRALLPADNTFVNVIITSDGVGFQKIYYNGVSQSVITGTSAPHATDGELVIGQRNTNYLTGKMSDVIVFNKVLSAEEITQLHTALI